MKILFVISKLSIGGIRQSFINLAWALQNSDYEIELQTFSQISPEDEKELNQYGVRILPPLKLMQVYQSTLRQQNSFIEKAAKLIIGTMPRLIGRERTIRCLLGLSNELDNNYDIVVSYSQSGWSVDEKEFYGGCEFYVLDKVNVKRRIAWIHGEPNFLGYNKSRCDRLFGKFNAVVCVSYACKDAFDRIAPEYANKCKVVYNLFHVEKIRKLADAPVSGFDPDCIHIVTVARLMNQAKRIDRIIECCVILKDHLRMKFKWHIVGGGPDMEYLKNLAVERDVCDVLFFLEEKSNPYPYMTNADLFVLSSDSESFGIVLIEAMIVGTPVITTSYEAATEVLTNFGAGVICDKSAASTADEIEKLILNPAMLNELRESLSVKSNFNDNGLKQFSELIDGVI